MANPDFHALGIAAAESYGKPEFVEIFNRLWAAADPFIRYHARGILGVDPDDDLIDEVSFRFWRHLREGGIAGFDPSKGRWTTWATWQVRGRIGNVLADARRLMRAAPGGTLSLDAIDGDEFIDHAGGDPAEEYERTRAILDVAGALSPEEFDVLLKDAGAIE